MKKSTNCLSKIVAEFMDELDYNDIIPTGKKKDRFDSAKGTHSPTKLYEKLKLLYNQYYDFFCNTLSLNQCAF